jgi:hypothetical protein
MRVLSNGVKALLTQTNVRVALLFEMEVGDDVYYLASTPHDLSWNGHTWLGNGWLRPFGDITEVAEIGASGLKLRIGGLDPAAVSIVLGPLVLKNYGTLYLAFLSETLAVTPNPFIIYRGMYDQAELRDDSTTSEIMLSYENSRIRHHKAKELRYTDQCQQSIWPGDTGFRYTSKTSDWSGFWGKAPKAKKRRRRAAEKV